MHVASTGLPARAAATGPWGRRRRADGTWTAAPARWLMIFPIPGRAKILQMSTMSAVSLRAQIVRTNVARIVQTVVCGSMERAAVNARSAHLLKRIFGSKLRRRVSASNGSNFDSILICLTG